MNIQDWLGKDNQLGIDIWNKKYRYNNETFDEWLDRVSAGDEAVKNLILEKKFLFGGRILANRGLDKSGVKITLSNCFVAGTQVLTSTGYKNIEDVQKGEYVLSDDGKFHLVNEVMQRDYSGDIYRLSSLNFKNDIYCTPNHQFLTNHGWKRADRILACNEQIKNQDKIKIATIADKTYYDNRENKIASDGVDYAHLKSISIVEGYNGTVYNLSVEDTHNYTVEGVIAHNCYVVSPPSDSIESIFECATKLARTYSYGGGCGIDISNLAPKGAKVHNTAKETSGAVSFMDLYSLVTGLIGQAGRRGALMISLSCEHPDIERFIEIKSDLEKVTKANISIRITDKFMFAVREDKDFTLSFTREETGETIQKTVKARDLFRKICEMNWDYGEPGMLFWDRIENWNILSNDSDFKYAGTNPCVAGDTLILTDNGFVKIKDVIDRPVNIWNGYQYSEVIPHITGHNQEMKRITFSDGNTLDCTLYHKFILDDNTRVEAKDLKIGSKIVKNYFPVIHHGKEIDEMTAYTQGFFMGDGSIENNRNRLSIKLFGEKRKVKNNLKYDSDVYCASFDGDFLRLPYEPQLFNKEFVPSIDYSVRSRLAWLAGYIDSDGTVQSSEGGVSISSTNKEVLMKVKYMLNTLGCNAWVSKMYDGGYKMLPKNDGSGESEEVYCKDSYRLLIRAATVRNLINLGLKLHRVNVSPNPNRDAARYITIVNVEDIDDCETVYCFNEPINHSGIFNGVITAQCAEEPLPAGGSCCLSSINLAEFVSDKKFDYSAFTEAVDIAVRALNEVLDEGLPLHPLQEQRESVRDWRQIGLGIFGLADMLIKLDIKYGSKEAIDLCDSIGFQMANQAIRTSALLAKEYGSYPNYNRDAVLGSEYLRFNASSDTFELVEKYGLHNSQLLTIAPTGTLSSMFGVSGGIEPIFANSYTRKTESLHSEEKFYKVYTPIVDKYMKANNIVDETKLPDYFVTAQDLDYINRIDMQAVWQKHIDASISSTANVPNSFTVEDVEKLYLYAWESGLKGVTIYRAGCAREGILVTEETKAKTKAKIQSNENQRGYVVPASDNLIGVKRKLMTGCGSLHCVAFFDSKTKELQETYLAKGSTGGCNNFMIGLSRMISLSARAGVKLDTIIDQLNSCGVCPSYATRKATKGDTSPGSCCPIAIGKALKEMHNELLHKQEVNVTNDNAPKCPKCNEELVHEGGCNICKNCGWSKCD